MIRLTTEFQIRHAQAVRLIWKAGWLVVMGFVVKGLLWLMVLYFLSTID